MKTLISLIVSFFMIFNINSISYATNFNNTVEFKTNIVSFSFDNKSISYKNDNLEAINSLQEQVKLYSLQFGGGILTSFGGIIIGLFIGVILGFAISIIFHIGINPAGIPYLAMITALIFSGLFGIIFSSLGINSVSKNFTNKEGNIWLIISVGTLTSIILGTLIIMFGSFQNNSLTKAILAFLLVIVSEVIATNLTMSKKITIEESL